MSTTKHIHWRPDMQENEEGKMFANVHLLVGYNQGTISDFQEMADELRKTFPEATDDKIRGGKVYRSNYVDGYTIIAWDAYVPQGEYSAWEQHHEGRPVEYRW